MGESNWETQQRLWTRVSELKDFERVDSLADLATSLWATNRKMEAIQVSHELLASLDGDFADANRIHCSIKIASWLTELGRYEESKDLIEETLKMPSFSYDSAGIGFLHWRQVDNLDKIGTASEKIQSLQKAIECFLDEDQEILGTLRCELASAAAALGNVDQAISEFRSAISLLESEGCSEMVCKAKLELGTLLLQKSEVDQATCEALDAEALANFLEEAELIQHSNLLSARVCSARGDIEEAEEYFVKAISLKGPREQKARAAEAAYYQAIHWKLAGNDERSQKQLKALVPVLRSLGEEQLSQLAQSAALIAG